MPLTQTLDQPETSLETLAVLFKAFGDPARIRILNLLAAKGELCNCHIESVTGYGNSKISRHFNYLRQANLIQSRREGLWIYYSLKPASNEIHHFLHMILDSMPGMYEILKLDLERIDALRMSPAPGHCNRDNPTS
ncbi:MAG: helix-turn-helix transcriptional regulator [SAR324 cluster bacterium]|nr:helix-turn-helix transcriptional regulator [SAR324 cluster bacterium]